MNRTIGSVLATAALAATAGLTAIITAGPATATGDCVTVHRNTEGITVTGDAKVELTQRGVRVTTATFSNEGAKWVHALAAPVPLDEVKHLSYRTIKHTNAKVDVALPAYLVKIQLPGDAGTATLVAEPYYAAAGADRAGQTTNVVWNVLRDGRFWTNNGATPGGMVLEAGGSYEHNRSWAQIAAANPGATVVGFGWQQSWAEGLSTTINNIKFSGSRCGNHHHKWDCPKPTTTPPTTQPTATPPTTAPTTRPTTPPTTRPTTTPATSQPPTAAPSTPPPDVPPPPSGGTGGGMVNTGGSLPLTGPALSLTIVGAAALIAAGLGALVLARRRRATRFTA